MSANIENPVVESVKKEISEKVSAEMNSRDLKIREIGRMTDVKHPQIVRITSEKNYTVDTVLKVLHGLGLTLKVSEK